MIKRCNLACFFLSALLVVSCSRGQDTAGEQPDKTIVTHQENGLNDMTKKIRSGDSGGANDFAILESYDELVAGLNMAGLKKRDYSASPGFQKIAGSGDEKYLVEILKNTREEIPDVFLLANERIERVYNGRISYGRNVKSTQEPPVFLEYNGSAIQFTARDGKNAKATGKMSLDEWDALLGGFVKKYLAGSIRLYGAKTVITENSAVFYVSYFDIPAEKPEQMLVKITRDGGVEKNIIDVNGRFVMNDLGFFYSDMYDMDYALGDWGIDDFQNKIIVTGFNLEAIELTYKQLISQKYAHFAHVVVLPFVKEEQAGFSILIGYSGIKHLFENRTGRALADLALYKTYVVDFTGKDKLKLTDEGFFEYDAQKKAFWKMFITHNQDRTYWNIAFLPESFEDTIQDDDFIEERLGKERDVVMIRERMRVYDENLLRKLINHDRF